MFDSQVKYSVRCFLKEVVSMQNMEWLPSKYQVFLVQMERHSFEQRNLTHTTILWTAQYALHSAQFLEKEHLLLKKSLLLANKCKCSQALKDVVSLVTRSSLCLFLQDINIIKGSTSLLTIVYNTGCNMQCFVQPYASCFVKEIRSAQNAFLIEDRGRQCSIKTSISYINSI